MTRAYSMDLRERVWQAADSGRSLHKTGVFTRDEKIRWFLFQTENVVYFIAVPETPRTKPENRSRSRRFGADTRKRQNGLSRPRTYGS